MARVLKSEGRVAIADIAGTAAYRKVLSAAGMQEAGRRRIFPYFLMNTHLVSATKDDRSA